MRRVSGPPPLNRTGALGVDGVCCSVSSPSRRVFALSPDASHLPYPCHLRDTTFITMKGSSMKYGILGDLSLTGGYDLLMSGEAQRPDALPLSARHKKLRHRSQFPACGRISALKNNCSKALKALAFHYLSGPQSRTAFMLAISCSTCSRYVYLFWVPLCGKRNSIALDPLGVVSTDSKPPELSPHLRC